MIKSKKILALVCAVTMTAGLMACGSKETGNTDAAQTTESTAAKTKTEETKAEETKAEETKEAEGAAISGTVSMAGSTSMEKLANAVAESFMAKYPDVTVTAEFTGSSAGVEAVTAGSVDIGNSSRALKDEEKQQGL